MSILPPQPSRPRDPHTLHHLTSRGLAASSPGTPLGRWATRAQSCSSPSRHLLGLGVHPVWQRTRRSLSVAVSGDGPYRHVEQVMSRSRGPTKHWRRRPTRALIRVQRLFMAAPHCCVLDPVDHGLKAHGTPVFLPSKFRMLMLTLHSLPPFFLGLAFPLFTRELPSTQVSFLSARSCHR